MKWTTRGGRREAATVKTDRPGGAAGRTESRPRSARGESANARGIGRGGGSRAALGGVAGRERIGRLCKVAARPRGADARFGPRHPRRREPQRPARLTARSSPSPPRARRPRAGP
ncbi:hypothetical protein [Lysobacter gummosus]|uniref:hypothetical protein n=1 Tax=Lysobacter gummosus TaxID=262324 RepID=UPI0036417ABB